MVYFWMSLKIDKVHLYDVKILKEKFNIKYDIKMIITTCPSCQGDVIILEEEIACGVFRHAVYKNGTDVGQHSSKEYMDGLIKNDLVWGCGRPFRLEKKEESYEAVECDWI
jgi:hypothetical protein